MRGEIVTLALKHHAALQRGEKRKFKKLTVRAASRRARVPPFSSPRRNPPPPSPAAQFCNIGNPQELRQEPITFFRQVLSLVNLPELLAAAETQPAVAAFFPPDVVARARKYLSAIPGGLGAYTHSQGIEIVREEVAAFISARDGVPARASDIYLSDGASPAAQTFLKAIIRGEHDGVMVPIPQYPLYSASIAL